MVQPHRNRILVVDDERLMRWSLTETLEDHGCEVVQASDATSAQAALAHAGTPDVVLLDLQLPDSTMLDFLSSIHAQIPTSKVVLMSSYMTPEIARDARSRGAYDVLAKPFDMSAVLTVVDRAAGS